MGLLDNNNEGYCECQNRGGKDKCDCKGREGGGNCACQNRGEGGCECQDRKSCNCDVRIKTESCLCKSRGMMNEKNISIEEKLSLLSKAVRLILLEVQDIKKMMEKQ